jgi:hypothetical protein
MAVQGDWEDMAGNGLDRVKKTTYVIWSDNETKIRCQDTTSEDWVPWCVCNGELESV